MNKIIFEVSYIGSPSGFFKIIIFCWYVDYVFDCQY